MNKNGKTVVSAPYTTAAAVLFCRNYFLDLSFFHLTPSQTTKATKQKKWLTRFFLSFQLAVYAVLYTVYIQYSTHMYKHVLFN
jgi:uncharacterized membrane protein YbhN (UPF0104 family)